LESESHQRIWSIVDTQRTVAHAALGMLVGFNAVVAEFHVYSHPASTAVITTIEHYPPAAYH